jgi:hypothetical protein
MGHYACDMRPEWFESDPKPETRRAIWVVEVFEGSGWRPTEWVGITRERAREQAKDWKAESCVERVRVTKYEA